VTRRRLGLVLVGVGAAMVVVAVLGLVLDRGSDEPDETIATSTTTTTTTTTPSTTTTSTTTTSTTSTTSNTTTATTTSTTTTSTTTTSSTTSTTTTSTTTTVPPTESIEQFVELYRDAIESGDVDFLMARLHPVVTEGFGAELCRGWIERVILSLEDYQLVGAVEGPTDRSFTTPAGTGVLEGTYAAPVSFAIGGQTFEVEAGFVPIGGEVFWLGECA
jgi:hypothetical protein